MYPTCTREGKTKPAIRLSMPRMQLPRMRLPGTRKLLSHQDVIRSFFEHAFDHDPTLDVVESMHAPEADVIESTAEGLRIMYSARTAEWLAVVAERPHDDAAITRHLNSNILSGTHPLCRLLDGLVGLLSGLLLETDRSLKTNKPSGDDGDNALVTAAACTELACTLMHGVLLSVLPPLGVEPAKQHSMELVRASIFDQLDGTLRQLLRATYGRVDHEANEAVISLGRSLLPRHLGVSKLLWLSGETQPYASVADILRSVPLVPAPEQKLRLVLDACSEIDACIRRHYVKRQEAGHAVANEEPLAFGEEVASMAAGQERQSWGRFALT